LAGARPGSAGRPAGPPAWTEAHVCALEVAHERADQIIHGSSLNILYTHTRLEARKERSRAARRASRGATAVMPRPLLLTRLDGALNRPLEARGCLMTC
jgi:hypothetical protein